MSEPNHSADVLLSAREIAHAAEQLATLAEEEFTPEVLGDLAHHADAIVRALVDFCVSCRNAAA